MYRMIGSVMGRHKAKKQINLKKNKILKIGYREKKG
jgi:hypothetical protein